MCVCVSFSRLSAVSKQSLSSLSAVSQQSLGRLSADSQETLSRLDSHSSPICLSAVFQQSQSFGYLSVVF